jgi:hypothetical protein
MKAVALDGLAWRVLAAKNPIVLDETLPHGVTKGMAGTLQFLKGKLKQCGLLRFNHEQHRRRVVYRENLVDFHMR